MKVRVDRARRDRHGQHFRLTLLSDDDQELGVEEFTYGSDVPLATIRREFLLLVRNRYEPLNEEILALEGQVIPLP